MYQFVHTIYIIICLYFIFDQIKIYNLFCIANYFVSS